MLFLHLSSAGFPAACHACFTLSFPDWLSGFPPVTRANRISIKDDMALMNDAKLRADKKSLTEREHPEL